MKAIVFHKPKDMRFEEVPDPILKASDDIILRVTSTAICGSDLHIYNGFLPQTRPMVMGHEFMGIVEEVGSEVTNLKKGDRVVVPFPIACGNCFFCGHGLPGHCEHSNPENYGPEGGVLKDKGGALFGYTDLYGGYTVARPNMFASPTPTLALEKCSRILPMSRCFFSPTFSQQAILPSIGPGLRVVKPSRFLAAVPSD
jgi:S-(hydroxymethyl)glutathione dehydrogenase/alcohol dehydrogenase